MESKIERLFVLIRVTVKTSLVIIQKKITSVESDIMIMEVDEAPPLYTTPLQFGQVYSNPEVNFRIRSFVLQYLQGI